MPLHVFAAVLAAALLHAGWNAVIKKATGRQASMLLLALVQGAIALPLLPFVPTPAPEAWGWVLAGGALHAGYKLMLTQAYTHADLSLAYPLARGTAPLIVMAVSALWMGASFGPTALAAIVAISAGVLLMAVKGGSGARVSRTALGYALATAAFTASYTLADGVGARVAGTASGFVLWMVLVDTGLMAAAAALTTGRAAFRGLGAAWRTGLPAGAMSLGAYWIAVWAFTQAPLALVAALRESSILFAALIAAVVLREPVERWRWVAAGLIAAGVLLTRL
ncbi:EamA family transporter [Pseudoroseicyclus tamaricis]|uniref:EamA family transporter n=1 Tax=Pseudoroseicyclus tamaricis TaxID=2705421 RepID=A0A6B2K2J0_9RHOB|nr:EamA family transporter [Pseudoroseicyclus tamaricis]NDV01992.1 EamA family transporter [Pseudoroseicyclus tamaricis]